MGSLEAIAVDKSGNIYLGSSFYGRIQLYSNTGRFIRGWFIETKGGGFRIALDKLDHLHVATKDGNFNGIFNASGQPIKEQQPEEVIYEPFYSMEHHTSDVQGNVYKIVDPFLFPHVVVKPKHGQQRTLITVPSNLWPFMGPLPCWGFALLLFAAASSPGLGKILGRKSY